MVAPSRIADQFVLRLPDGMRDEIKRNAIENGRSMNAEIVFHLRRALGPAAGGDAAKLAPTTDAYAKDLP